NILKPSIPFVPTTRYQAGAQISPDGRKVAFISSRSGTSELWLCDNDGSNLVQRTHLGDGVNGPRWSPDSRRIAFFATTGAAGGYQIYVVDAASGSPRRLSADSNQQDFVPAWSRDGRWIYFGSTRSGAVQIWKMPADGGKPIQITKGGGADPWEGP